MTCSASSDKGDHEDTINGKHARFHTQLFMGFTEFIGLKRSIVITYR